MISKGLFLKILNTHAFFCFIGVECVSVTSFQIFVLRVDDVHGGQQQIWKNFAHFAAESAKK